jgi:MFS family permease
MVGRAIQGAGVGIGSATATAAIVDVSTSPRRAGVMAALAMLIGAGSGTLLSGLISAHAPWPTTTPFLVYTALLLPATLALNFVPETVQRSSGRLLRPLPRLGLKSPARSAFASAATIGACATSTNTVVVTLLPLLLLTTTRVNDRQATGIVIAIYLAFGGFAQLAFQRQGAATKCVIGLLALSAGIVAAAFSHHHLVVMEVGIVVAGAGSGVAWGGSLSYCAEQLPPARRAELLSAYYASSYILNTVAVVVVGGTADRVGLGVAFTGFSFAVVVLSTLAGVMVWRDGRALRRARMDDLF